MVHSAAKMHFSCEVNVLMLGNQEAKPAKALSGKRDPLNGWRGKARGQADPDSLPSMLVPQELPEHWLHLGSLSFSVKVDVLPSQFTSFCSLELYEPDFLACLQSCDISLGHMFQPVQGVACLGYAHAFCPRHASVGCERWLQWQLLGKPKLPKWHSKIDAGTSRLKKCAWVIHHQLRSAHIDKSVCL